MIEFKTRIYFYHDAAWHLCPDVMMEPAPSWEGGLIGAAAMDLVATTGILMFSLDNSETNSEELAGYYSPGHTNCPAWFTDGLKVKVVCERQDTMVSSTRFLGEMVKAKPTSGVYEQATTEVKCHDWMEYVSTQKVGLLAILSNKRADEALTAALANFPIQPEATDFDAGIETFPLVFNTDDGMKMTMASLFQKMARNEGGGYIYLTGDGTLTFNNRHFRPLTVASAFALDATGTTPMNALDIAWDRQFIKNRVECETFPARTDSTATTVLWKLQQSFGLSPGQELIITCPLRDPATGKRISATDIVDPLVSNTHIKFGSLNDGASNDLIANLTFPMVVGGNFVEITLTNTGAATGYVNFIEIKGKGIYTYEPLTLEAEDAASIATKGEKILNVKVEQITNPNTAQAMATSLLQQNLDPAAVMENVRFLANFDDDFATAALTAEVNTRFSLIEAQTGLDVSAFICRLKYTQEGPLLWVDIIPSIGLSSTAGVNWFIYDLAGHGWDEGVYIF